MLINTNTTGEVLNIALSGRLDTTTAPELEGKLSEVLEGVKDLVFDLKELEYISSAGLRVLLATQKTMNKVGTMKVVNVAPSVMEVFEITGFVDILTIE
ncbi:MAG: STAS domain-containing protein [Lachnospiraceae bacterium]|nr:STAS domain-containing protein [Lachnospiraceae bacterium]